MIFLRVDREAWALNQTMTSGHVWIYVYIGCWSDQIFLQKIGKKYTIPVYMLEVCPAFRRKYSTFEACTIYPCLLHYTMYSVM